MNVAAVANQLGFRLEVAEPSELVRSDSYQHSEGPVPFGLFERLYVTSKYLVNLLGRDFEGNFLLLSLMPYFNYTRALVKSNFGIFQLILHEKLEKKEKYDDVALKCVEKLIQMKKLTLGASFSFIEVNCTDELLKLDDVTPTSTLRVDIVCPNNFSNEEFFKSLGEKVSDYELRLQNASLNESSRVSSEVFDADGTEVAGIEGKSCKEKRSLTLGEIVSSQADYLSRLLIIAKDHQKPLSEMEQVLSGTELDLLFKDLGRIIALEEDLRIEFSKDSGLVSVLTAIDSYLRNCNVYRDYYSLHEKRQELVLNGGSKAFKRHCTDIKTFKLQLKDLIGCPVQRIPRLMLLLKEVLKLTPRADEHYQIVFQTYQAAKAVVRYLDVAKGVAERIQAQNKILKEFSESSEAHKALSRIGRWLVEECRTKIQFKTDQKTKEHKVRLCFMSDSVLVIKDRKNELVLDVPMEFIVQSSENPQVLRLHSAGYFNPLGVERVILPVSLSVSASKYLAEESAARQCAKEQLQIRRRQEGGTCIYFYCYQRTAYPIVQRKSSIICVLEQESKSLASIENELPVEYLNLCGGILTNAQTLGYILVRHDGTYLKLFSKKSVFGVQSETTQSLVQMNQLPRSISQRRVTSPDIFEKVLPQRRLSISGMRSSLKASLNAENKVNLPILTSSFGQFLHADQISKCFPPFSSQSLDALNQKLKELGTRIFPNAFSALTANVASTVKRANSKLVRRLSQMNLLVFKVHDTSNQPRKSSLRPNGSKVDVQIDDEELIRTVLRKLDGIDLSKTEDKIEEVDFSQLASKIDELSTSKLISGVQKLKEKMKLSDEKLQQILSETFREEKKANQLMTKLQADKRILE